MLPTRPPGCRRPRGVAPRKTRTYRPTGLRPVVVHRTTRVTRPTSAAGGFEESSLRRPGRNQVGSGRAFGAAGDAVPQRSAISLTQRDGPVTLTIDFRVDHQLWAPSAAVW